MKLFKYKEYNNNTSNITYKYLMLSLFSVVICASLLCLTSYAWFTSTTATSVSSVKAATYNLSYILDDRDTEISISNEGTSTEAIESATDSVKIILIASETSSKTGYCVIKVGDDTYYTNQIAAGSSYSFTLSNVNNKIITFYPHWGEPPSTMALTPIVGTKIDNNELTLSTTSLYSSDEEDAIAVVDESDTDVDTVVEDETSSDDITTDTIDPNDTSDGADTSKENNNTNVSNDETISETPIDGADNSNSEISGNYTDTGSQETTDDGQNEFNESEQPTDVSSVEQ